MTLCQDSPRALCKESHIRAEQGFSLIELIIVIAIIVIVLTTATLNFNTWQKKYGVEAQTRQMFTDFTAVRLEAIYRKQFATVTINTNSYVVTLFATEALTNGTILMTQTLKYPIQQFTSGTPTSFSNTVITIDPQGYIGSGDYMTIAVAPSLVDAAINCLSVQGSSINIGGISGTSCVLK